MKKLYITLEYGENKVEREIVIDDESKMLVNIEGILEGMMDTMDENKLEAIRLEAQRLTQHND